MTFEDILSNDDLLDAVYDMHFDKCTPIQERAIPPALEGKDVLAVAQTGTGKTAAYLLPVIERLINDNYPQDRVNCVIMAPTRELAQQIDRQLEGFIYYLPITSMPIYGGTDGKTYQQQKKGLKSGADIIIATPGRLLTHINMGYVDLSQVSFFILDEADRMLDMGFFDDIMKIVGKTPKNRQTMLYSATMPPDIRKLAKSILNDPVEIKLSVSKPAEKIKQSAFVCYERQKNSLLNNILDIKNQEKVIVFVGSKIKVKQLYNELKKKNFKVAEMHSDLEQIQRDNVLLDFKAGKVKVIIATDIISRGIDIENIETIINFDVPKEVEEYIHRVGRTARAEKEGEAITFISEKEINRFKKIEKFLGKKIEKSPLPDSFEKGPEYSSYNKSDKERGKRFSKRKNSSFKTKSQEKKFKVKKV